MKLTYSPYAHSERAFLELVEFASAAFPKFNPPRNWLVDRWNFTMTVGRTMHGMTIDEWAASIGLWRDETGRIRAIAHEEEGKGDAFFEFSDPGAFSPALFAEMLDFAERACGRKRGEGFGFALRVPERHELLAEMARSRGYAKLDWSELMSVRPVLRDGTERAEGRFGELILTVGPGIKPEEKALAHAKAFGYADKPEMLPASVRAFAALRDAPSYREDLDLALRTNDGQIAAFVGLWVDPDSGYAVLEPVGTIPEYRRKGLASWLIDEGERRVAKLGAKRLYVGSDQDFYRAIGFEVVIRQNLWEYREAD